MKLVLLYVVLSVNFVFANTAEMLVNDLHELSNNIKLTIPDCEDCDTSIVLFSANDTIFGVSNDFILQVWVTTNTDKNKNVDINHEIKCAIFSGEYVLTCLVEIKEDNTDTTSIIKNLYEFPLDLDNNIVYDYIRIRQKVKMFRMEKQQLCIIKKMNY